MRRPKTQILTAVAMINSKALVLLNNIYKDFRMNNMNILYTIMMI
jgi:hypothetical protein